MKYKVEGDDASDLLRGLLTLDGLSRVICHPIWVTLEKRS